MPIIHVFAYLLLVASAWLFRASYVGWLGPYVFAAVILLPLVMLLVSLPSMMGLQIRLITPTRIMRESDGKLTVEFINPRLMPIHSVTVHLEIRNRYTGERTRHNFIFRNLESSRSEVPLDTKDCGELECSLLRC